MVSNRIVIIAVTITIAVASAVVYAISSSGGSKSDPLREQGANCPELRPLSEAGDVHQGTELGKYIGELRAVKAPQVFEGASKSVADEFQRLSAVTEEDARKVVDELQTATSLDSPSPRTTLFLALLHRVAEERKRLDAVTASISTTSSTIASIVANAENTYLNGSRSNEELCAMNAVHHYAAQLRDHLAAVTLSATTATAAAQQHYATTIPWIINGTYQHYSIDLIYNQFTGYVAKAPPQLLQKSLDDVATGSGGGSSSDWYWLKIVGYVIGGIVVLFVIVVVIMRYGGGAEFVKKHYLLYQLKQVEADYSKSYNDRIDLVNAYFQKASINRKLVKYTDIIDDSNLSEFVGNVLFLLDNKLPIFNTYIGGKFDKIIAKCGNDLKNKFKRMTTIVLLMELHKVLENDENTLNSASFIYHYFFKQENEHTGKRRHARIKAHFKWNGYPIQQNTETGALSELIEFIVTEKNTPLQQTWNKTGNKDNRKDINFITSLMSLTDDEKNNLNSKVQNLGFSDKYDEQNIQLLYHTINLLLNYKQGQEQDNSSLIQAFKDFITSTNI